MAVRSCDNGCVREMANKAEKVVVVDLIDKHFQRQLRSHLFDVCSALHAANLPVLVLLECFAWSAAATLPHAHKHCAIPPDTQWRIAKLIRDRQEHPQSQ